MTRAEALQTVLNGKVVRPVGYDDMEFWYDETQVMPFRMRDERLGIIDWDWAAGIYTEWEVVR